jgi:hypothetical protein
MVFVKVSSFQLKARYMKRNNIFIRTKFSIPFFSSDVNVFKHFLKYK